MAPPIFTAKTFIIDIDGNVFHLPFLKLAVTVECSEQTGGLFVILTTRSRMMHYDPYSTFVDIFLILYVNKV